MLLVHQTVVAHRPMDNVVHTIVVIVVQTDISIVTILMLLVVILDNAVHVVKYKIVDVDHNLL
jgi:hypothetical protein